MAIILRLVKGAPLTIEEMDGNFTDLDGRVSAVEDSDSGGSRQIDFIEQIANSIVIHYTDTTEDGPFNLGQFSMRGQGEWLPSTNYLVGDTVTAGGVVYLVLFNHTSDLTFDPGANDGDAHDYYGELFDIPGGVLPVGGVTGQILKKASATNYDVQWQDEGVGASIVEVSTTTFTLNTPYAGAYIRFTHPDGCEVTVPLHLIDDMSIGTEFHLRQANAGAVNVVGDSDSSDTVIINPSRDGFNSDTQWQGATLTVKKVDDNEWDIIGPAGSEPSA